MKVKELLKALEGVDPEMEVSVFADHHGTYFADEARVQDVIVHEDDSELGLTDMSDPDEVDFVELYEYTVSKTFWIAG